MRSVRPATTGRGEEGRQQREVHGLYRRRSDERISTTDPDATPMRLKNGGLHLGYHTHYVVDGGKRRIILTTLVTPAEVTDNMPMLDLVFHTRWSFRLKPRQVTGDTKYATIENIKALEDQGIRAYVPLPNWEEQHEVWSSSHFHYEPEADQYRCPQGQVLYRAGEVDASTGRQLYRAPAPLCNSCPVKAQCTTSTQGRRVYRPIGVEYLERVRTYEQTPAYQKALRKRQVWVEPLFAEAKDWHGMRRFRLRRVFRVNCEALVIAAGHNLQQLLKKRGWGRHPFPTEALSASFLLCWVICLLPFESLITFLLISSASSKAMQAGFFFEDELIKDFFNRLVRFLTHNDQFF